MKPYETYQHLAGEPMTKRDEQEVGSKFWNKGKWDNFVAPFLPGSCDGLSIVDMGCNAGLFLKLAQDRGFERIIGIDSNEPAINKGKEWRDANRGNYEFRLSRMEDCLKDLPVVDYTVLANAHYYFTINDWVKYVDELRYKSRYVIIVTAYKQHINRCWASADVPSIRNYFKDWDETGFINELPLEGEPGARRLWALCFKSRHLDKVPIESLDSSNHVQDEFYGELDKGKHYTQTRYYRILKPYRKKWSEERLHKWIEERIRVYEDVKKNGVKEAILVDFFSPPRILDGNHRYAMMRNLGYKHVFVRNV